MEAQSACPFLTPMRFDFRILKFSAAIALIPIALAVYATSGSSHRKWSADEMPTSFWAWKTALPETAELRSVEDKAGTTKLFVRAGQMDLNDGEVTRTRPAKGRLPESVEVHLVYNATRGLLRSIASVDAENLSTAVAMTFAEDVERFGSANVKGIQLDLDFPTRLLPQYEQTLIALRSKLPRNTKLSITGLPTWMSSVAVKPLLNTVDFWTPQLYGAEIPVHIGQPIPISSAREIRRATIAARDLEKPFMAGLAAYGYAIQYDNIRKNVDSRDEESLCESAHMLKALSNNKTFFTGVLNDELENWGDFQKVNLYTAQTFTFAVEGDFMVRANVWVPPAEIPQDQTWTNEMFYYLVPHDHNFSFLTVGFFGPGYETTIYEYDGTTVLGELGEKVDLRFLEQTRLSEGKVMFYRANKDIHSQSHPEEFSISLNLLASPPEQGFKDQFCFDFDSGTISADVATTNMTRIMLCKLAKYVGDGRSVNLLESLADRHPAPRVRAEAYDSLANLEYAGKEYIWDKALLDKSAYVQMRARSSIETAR